MKDINNNAQQEAEHFLNNEKQFHLGMLPTEQSNPKTKHIDLRFEKDPADGVATLLSVDRDIHTMAQKVLKSPAFNEMEIGYDCLFMTTIVISSSILVPRTYPFTRSKIALSICAALDEAFSRIVL